MQVLAVIVIALGALLAGVVAGWMLGGRGVAVMRTEDFKRAIVDLAGAEERAKAAEGLRAELSTIRDERDAAWLHLSGREADMRAAEARIGPATLDSLVAIARRLRKGRERGRRLRQTFADVFAA